MTTDLSFSGSIQKTINKINKRQQESLKAFEESLKRIGAKGYINKNGESINILDL